MARRRRSNPRRPVEGLRSLLGELTPGDDLGALQHAWSASVGAAIAEAGRPVAIEDGVLHVRCADATWAHTLQLMESDIIARLRDGGAPGVEGVRAIRTGVEAS
ncbi:MAG: DciA family protein [Solirubrobacteraceae bacterium]